MPRKPRKGTAKQKRKKQGPQFNLGKRRIRINEAEIAHRIFCERCGYSGKNEDLDYCPKCHTDHVTRWMGTEKWITGDSEHAKTDFILVTNEQSQSDQNEK
jgi:RNA polymerase subunit RPABC4/transcription elongation factor Spt4